MIIDIHNHTSKYSFCSIIAPDNLIKKYINCGIEAICITEHDFLWPKYEQEELKKKYGDKIKIFFGVEANTDYGHVLVFGIEHYDFGSSVRLKTLVNNLDKKNTVFIWAHPLRWQMAIDFKITNKLVKTFDAVELYNGNLSENKIIKSKKYFDKFDVKYTGGSDTHSAQMACNYATKFNNNISSLSEFVNEIKTGKYHPVKIL